VYFHRFQFFVPLLVFSLQNYHFTETCRIEMNFFTSFQSFGTVLKPCLIVIKPPSKDRINTHKTHLYLYTISVFIALPYNNVFGIFFLAKLPLQN